MVNMQNICRIYHVLAQFSFTTSETELVYYQQKVMYKAAECLKTKNLKKLKNFDICARKLRKSAVKIL